jgi:hypothetical protein
MAEVGEEHAQLYHAGQRAAAGAGDRREILEYLVDFVLDGGIHQGHAVWVERNLTRAIHRVADLYRLRIGADGGGSIVGMNDLAGHERDPVEI